MSLSRFDSTGELIEFVSFSSEVARGQDETAHLFEFSSNTASLAGSNASTSVPPNLSAPQSNVAAPSNNLSVSQNSSSIPVGANSVSTPQGVASNAVAASAAAASGLHVTSLNTSASGGTATSVTPPVATAENPQHVFLVIGPQSKEARVDSYIASMALKSLQRGYMNPKDKLYFSTLVGFDTAAEAKGPKTEKLLKTVERWINQAQPRCVILLRRGESGLRCHKLTDPIHDKLVEISEKQILGTEIALDSLSGNTLQDEILRLCLKKDVSILEIGLDPIQKSFEECSQSEWKLSTGPVLRWMFESLPFKMTIAPELPVLEVIPPLEIPAEFNL
jgi:hypothetical protein